MLTVTEIPRRTHNHVKSIPEVSALESESHMTGRHGGLDNSLKLISYKIALKTFLKIR